jgi:hypothetical protein
MYQKIVSVFFLKNKEPRIKSASIEKGISITSLTLSFPFRAGITVSINSKEKDIAKEAIIMLVNRRILNASECCPSCSQQSIDSLKEIKSDLIQIEKKLINSVNGSLFYFIDSIISGVNQFLKYIEDNNFMETFPLNREIYFEGFNIIRNHIVQCLYQISKIADYEIRNDLFAVRNNKESWEYLNSNIKHKNGIIDIFV